MSYSKSDILQDLLVLAVLGGLLFGTYAFLKPSLHKMSLALRSPVRSSEPVPMGTPADFDWVVEDLNGKKIELSSFKGKVIFLNFWATWCGPCKMEMPGIVKLHGQFKDSVVFLLVSEEEIKALNVFARAQNLHVPIYAVKKIPEFFKVIGIPTTFILDRSGRVALSYSGAKDWDRQKIVDMVNGLLVSPKTNP